MRRLSWTLIFLILTTSVFGRLDVNVALNRPTFVSSMHYDALYGGYFYPSKGNDGNHDTEALKADNSCVHTQVIAETHPWWAVDLGVPLSVTGVQFTNRNGWGYVSNNFVIGLTDVSPDVTAPTLMNYDVCGQWPGVVGEGATVYLKCTSALPPRRYLIAQFPVIGHMNFCEISVYIRRWEWVYRQGQRMVNKVANSFEVAHRLCCMTNCTLSPDCDSYNYRPSDKTCELNTHDTPLNASSTDLVVDNAWRWYHTTFTVVL